ncbi:right-handed parallel beta-helix repeat-containing protein [Candidatus Bathyarchaeota archaeon]|nr:right-handed parallel beta-helix repeat-containing protein [Candidatus Bathyarchaeota archaeon]
MKPFSMSKKTVYTVIITLFLLIILSLKVENQSVKAEPDNITVPNNYPTIQEAINAANPGDTINVRVGTYYEHLNVNKPLTLIGESRESTIIDGSGEDRAIVEVTASNVVISRFTVQNCSRAAGTSYAGIKVSGYACNITYNFVTKSKIGIFVTSKGSRIAYNVVENNGQGIVLYSSSEVTVEANNVSANTVGISLALSFNNRIMGNRALNSYTGGHGITISSNSFNNTIRANELMDNYHGMWLSSSSNNSVLENTIANNKLLGIELANSPDNTFYHNNFINNGLPPHAPSIKHVTIDSKSESIWDDSYPSGGNYWYDYTDVDEKSGPNQDQAGSDEIWDNSYVINENNRDNYPSVRPYGDISHIIPDDARAGGASPLSDFSSLWINMLAGVIVIVMVVALFWKRSTRNKKKKKLRKIRLHKHH